MMRASTLCILFLILIGSGKVISGQQVDTQSQVAQNEKSSDVPSQKLTNEAVIYYQKLLLPLNEFKIGNYHYIKSVTRLRKAKTVEKRRQELLKTLQSNLSFYKSFDTFHNDTTLKSELIKYLELTNKILKYDFDKIVDMEDILEQSYDQAEAHQLALDIAVEKLNSYFRELKKADIAFLKKYDIKVSEKKDEITLKIEKANEALDYYNSIYRIFFKANKENLYTSVSITKKDVAGIEQHAMTLVSLSEDGLSKLSKMDGYNGDNELLTMVIKILQFYKHEGSVSYPANIDFILKTDNFQETSKKFNSIKPDRRTQADVDKYNSSVNVYNKATKNINKINQTSYKEHNKLIDLWNKEVEKFFNKHS